MNRFGLRRILGEVARDGGQVKLYQVTAKDTDLDKLNAAIGGLSSYWAKGRATSPGPIGRRRERSERMLRPPEV